jgi:xanthine/uracil permease
MSNTTPNLGNIIPSGTARRIVYGTYAVAAVIVGGIAAYFIATGHPLPEPVVGAQGVIAYLGIPVGGLALANTPTATP